MKALTITPKTRTVAVQDVPKPDPKPLEILIKVHAVALNHVDALYTKKPIASQDYRVVGSDFAGEVVAVGADLVGVDDQRTEVGARVAGFVQGACSVNERPGAFAEYVAVEYDLTWAIPTTVTYEAAATISLCGLTAAQGVFARLQLPCPFSSTKGFDPSQAADNNKPIHVLVYGATSSLGLYAAQLIRLAERTSGKKIKLIGTASASKHAVLKEKPYEYDELVDYHDPEWPEKVRGISDGGVQFAVDAVSQSPSVELVEQTLAEDGKFAVFRSPAIGGFDLNKLKNKPVIGAVWEGLGAEIQYQGATIPANPVARKFTTEFYSFLGSEASLGNVKLQPNPVRLIRGGLEEIPSDGFVLLDPRGSGGQRPLSTEKAVFTI
ncbi:hypothetical protein CkaCkLH20_04261 [Colletotrichum karsti]|uniref:Enoyl reductase (ER) domain-containing protein n=1 Tax=Colletotrichum karsti TaxID=1095194 RepID=A0A9P6I8B6_9PEZI|nr:uncharacterized protein CkaCkLH20_04261 [Colletotrichum karsti]KAF9878223.1 hypothetical protein CkaCkLH20_04261 [Colletotrichum karsti]